MTVCPKIHAVAFFLPVSTELKLHKPWTSKQIPVTTTTPFLPTEAIIPPLQWETNLYKKAQDAVEVPCSNNPVLDDPTNALHTLTP